MTDLALLAAGFGAIPLAAIALYAVADLIGRHRAASWGILAGVIGFLGLSHAMALVLVNHSLLGDVAVATGVSVLGLAIGGGIAWLLLEGPLIRTEPNRVLGAAVVFLTLHSLGDGLVLGTDFIGGFVPAVRIDAVTVSATAVHRLVEGSLVVVPALAASWKARSTFLLLLAALASIPAAFVPTWIFDAFGFSPMRSTIALSTATFLASVEATFALLLLLRAFVPIASTERGTRWLAWTAIGFAGISLVHFFVE